MSDGLDPKRDVVFKLLFAHPNNGDLLRSMIEAVVEPRVPIESVTVLNPEMPRVFGAHKAIVLDVHVRCADGTLIDVEREAQPRPGLAPRLLYYWSRIHAEQLERGDIYAELHRSISIVWLNGLIPGLGPRFHSCYHLAEDQAHLHLTDHLEVHLLALPQFAADEGVDGSLARWARFFLARDDEERHALAAEDPMMSKAVTELDRISSDPEARRALEEIEVSRRVYEHTVAAARREARDDALLDVVRRMVAGGRSIAEIVEATGLDPTAIEALAGRQVPTL